ncbi:SRPBCC family protein [Maritimibacter dapengensis]|uniref:SRPBCC domain-containing protein n=1 Tax=Maritimibacter dapengensis TaxID=2836868 RepID=A0ABS6T3I6_9RHOB|nr:SRPBCC family protein [Maritimibacter dapengensis]MBV7379760.1 SRPBCC domain-containing protein [Maritimibacter dapengensis]
MTDLSLTVDRIIKAPQERVFNAWLDPEMLARFIIPGPGMTVPHAASDAREGGRFEIVMKAGDDEIPHAGEYREIKPHERIVFTWESPFSVEDSTVTLTFDPVEGGTRVTLTHVRFPDKESRDNHEGGWNAILEALDGVMV